MVQTDEKGKIREVAVREKDDLASKRLGEGQPTG